MSDALACDNEHFKLGHVLPPFGSAAIQSWSGRLASSGSMSDFTAACIHSCDTRRSISRSVIFLLPWVRRQFLLFGLLGNQRRRSRFVSSSWRSHITRMATNSCDITGAFSLRAQEFEGFGENCNHFPAAVLAVIESAERPGVEVADNI
jgi:hypothetical protein